MREWPARRWAAAALVAVVAGLLMGIPTGVIRSSLYHRMTPVQWWNYPVWAISAVLIGLTGATYFVRRGMRPSAAPLTGGILSTFAIGCPICNKLVVAALGLSGALNIWAPIQPWLGVGSVALLGYALRRRLLGELACPLPVGDRASEVPVAAQRESSPPLGGTPVPPADAP